MKKILFTLFIVILFVFCRTEVKTNDSFNIPENTVRKNFSVQKFIPHLPHELKETSGLIFYDNLFWTFNDSGGKNKIFGVNASGKIVKEIKLKNAKNIDWEDITQDKKYIYIGDFGNNRGIRNNQKIYRIKKSKIDKKFSQSLEAGVIDFSFADQNEFIFSMHNTRFDCEAMVEFHDNLFVFTKDWKTQNTTVYKIPQKTEKNKAQPLEHFNINGLVTAADINPAGDKLVLLGYKNLKPFLWIFSGISDNSFFEGDKIYSELDDVNYSQTEGVCFAGNDSLFISCEKTSSFLQQIFLIDLKAAE